jgi:hypothetical protein
MGTIRANLFRSSIERAVSSESLVFAANAAARDIVLGVSARQPYGSANPAFQMQGLHLGFGDNPLTDTAQRRLDLPSSTCSPLPGPGS